eukprot:CAMPEP_0114283732 /NCGR_PEP_ID=MMETSP0059-20121206/4264_1 /TAXON_ID=36894 /ORGANISM="Pyramimonas parkeae, Strain CCMP726" /LENGTH=606 /DNA_ID=CAMNT_0001404491 /DNA_START=11 /DNA_END=1831 /DNA_ORIENTATION=+
MEDDSTAIKSDGTDSISVIETPCEMRDTDPELREDLLQSAVGFLCHPQVQGSPIEKKREFLVKKGLTEAEIVEAFRRVPENTAIAHVEATPSTMSPPTRPFARPSTNPLPRAGLPGGSFPASASTNVHPQPTYMLEQSAPSSTGPRWTQMGLAAGVLSVGAYCARSSIAPLLRPVVTKMFPQEVPPAVPKHENSISSVAMPNPPESYGAIQELKEALITSNAALSARTDELTKTTQLLVELIRTVQTETSLIPNALKEATSLIPAAIKDASEAGFHGIEKKLDSLSIQVANCMVPTYAGSAMAASNGSSTQMQHQLSEIRSLLERTLPEGNQHQTTAPTPRNPGALSGTPPATPEPERHQIGGLLPAEAGNTDPSLQMQASPEDVALNDQKRPRGPGAPPPEELPPHPRSYAEVLEMLEKGQTPPGIREIDDHPPNPSQELSGSRMQPRPKPWERKKHVPADAGSGTVSPMMLRVAGAASPPWTVAETNPAALNSGSDVGESSPMHVHERGNTAKEEIDECLATTDNKPCEWKPPPRPEISLKQAAVAMGMSKDKAPLMEGISKHKLPVERTGITATPTEVTATPSRRSYQGKLSARESSSSEDDY